MRTYFKQILEETYETFGTRQCENMDDEQYTRLLDKLVFVSKLYPYIPEDEQKKIIDKRLVTDKEYRNINARLISTWLELDGKTFHKELAHEPTVEHTPATPEQVQQRLKEWEEMLKNVTTTFSVGAERKGNGQRMKEDLEKAGIVHEPKPEEKSQPTYFCLKTNVCAEQCIRCKSEQEIISKSEEELTNQTEKI